MAFFIFAEIIYPIEHAIFPNLITQPRMRTENHTFPIQNLTLRVQKFMLEAIDLT